jgi:copper chaperone NosL
MRKIVSICLTILLAINLTACGEKETVEVPPPAALTQEAIGYYCNMTVADHQGPKGQIRLKGQTGPVWFSSVRDTIAFTMLPEEPKDIVAIYVTDMSQPGSWENPKGNVWIDAKSAFYVTGSSMRGGMGAPETVPFGTRDTAEEFSRQHGGKIVGFSEIPKASILGMVEVGDGHEDMTHDDEHETMNMESGG